MFKRALSFGLALSVAGTTISAQSIDRRLASRLDARTHAAVAAIIDSAEGRRLPIEPLIDKALEGAAKKAQSQQIISAVQAYVRQLEEARAALGEMSTPAELMGGAQALRAGIPVSQLKRLRQARQNAQIAAALTVVSDLVSREVPIDTAVTVVASLINAAATDEQLLAVRGNVETDILGGMQPALAASTRGHALAQTLAVVPNGAPGSGTLPSPSGTNRAGDATGTLNPPGRVNGQVAPAARPPVSQRKRP